LLRVEEIEDLHGKLQQGLADDTLIQVFELWREGRTVTQMMDALGMSRATVYRKLELITLRGQQLFAPPDNT
jgi:response regulator of citrate/malate metabolism